jgi:hypothetical protein
MSKEQICISFDLGVIFLLLITVILLLSLEGQIPILFGVWRYHISRGMKKGGTIVILSCYSDDHPSTEKGVDLSLSRVGQIPGGPPSSISNSGGGVLPDSRNQKIPLCNRPQ